MFHDAPLLTVSQPAANDSFVSNPRSPGCPATQSPGPGQLSPTNLNLSRRDSFNSHTSSAPGTPSAYRWNPYSLSDSFAVVSSPVTSPLQLKSPPPQNLPGEGHDSDGASSVASVASELVYSAAAVVWV